MSDKTNPSIFVQRLHALQIREGLTIKEMAERCDLPKSSLESYMRAKGAKRPGLDAITAIAKGLDVSMDWLVGLTEESYPRAVSDREVALMCFNVVQTLLNWLADQQKNSNDPIFASENISGLDFSTIAAQSMIEFTEMVRDYSKNAHEYGAWRNQYQIDLENALNDMKTSN